MNSYFIANSLKGIKDEKGIKAMKPCQDEISHGALSHSHSEPRQNEAKSFQKLHLNFYGAFIKEYAETTEGPPVANTLLLPTARNSHYSVRVKVS